MEVDKFQEKEVDNLILYGLGKLFSDHSTRLIGEINNNKKRHHFEQAVKYIDKFINVIEKGVKEEHNQKTLEIIVTDMNKGINQFREELLK